jgi:hypothetical protein
MLVAGRIDTGTYRLTSCRASPRNQSNVVGVVAEVARGGDVLGIIAFRMPERQHVIAPGETVINFRTKWYRRVRNSGSGSRRA